MKRINKYLNAVLSRLTDLLILPSKNEEYCIKKGYRHRKLNFFFDDTGNDDHWQREVYIYAKKILEQTNGEKVVDLGCGSGRKLIHFFDGHHTIGVDLKKTVLYLKNKYPNRKWIDFDEASIDASILDCDVVICSDVIEHLQDPNQITEILSKIKSKYIIMSTPDRALLNEGINGPPRNYTHNREWTMNEFKSYLEQSGFFVEEIFISNREQATQCALISKNK